MKIQLAYAYEGHDPDDVITVDDVTGRMLITEGRARIPDATTPKSQTETSKTK